MEVRLGGWEEGKDIGVGGRGGGGEGRGGDGEKKKREICQQHTSALCRSDTNSSQQYDLKHNRSFVKKNNPRTKLNWHSVAGKSLQARPAFSEGKLTNATLAVATSSFLSVPAI